MEPIIVTLQGVRGGSKIKDPADGNSYEVTALVPVSEVARVIASGPSANLRAGCSTDPTANKRSGSVVNDIKNQLVDDPTAFVRKNNGITLIADEATVDAHGKPGTLQITYSSPTFLRAYKTDPTNLQQIRGVGNGGTTTGAIAEAVAEGLYPNANGSAFVKLSVRCGAFTREDVLDIVEGLNKNRQVDSFSTANYGGLFEPLKTFLNSDAAELHGRAFPPVAYYFGDSGQYEVQELIQILTLFARRDVDGEPVPDRAYSGVESCLKYFQSSDGNRECLRFLPLLPSLVYLYEFIIANARTAYNIKGSFYGLSLFAGMEKAKETLPFSHLETTTRAHNGWVFPILAAFIPAVSDNKKSWRVDPQTLFLRLAPKMITELNNQFVSLNGGRVSSLGRTAAPYTVLRALVEVDVMRQERRAVSA